MEQTFRVSKNSYITIDSALSKYQYLYTIPSESIAVIFGPLTQEELERHDEDLSED